MGKTKSKRVSFLVVLNPDPGKKRPGWRQPRGNWEKDPKNPVNEHSFKIEVRLTQDEIKALKHKNPLDIEDVKLRKWVRGLISDAIKKISEAAAEKTKKEMKKTGMEGYKYERGLILGKEKDLNIEITI